MPFIPEKRQIHHSHDENVDETPSEKNEPSEN